jgi:hypothetical protein
MFAKYVVIQEMKYITNTIERYGERMSRTI